MLSKNVVFLLVSFLLLRVSSGNGEEELEKVQEFIEGIKDRLEQIANNITARVEELANKEQQKSAEISANISSTISEAIECLQSKAQVLEVNVSECFELLPAGAEAIGINLTDGAIGCIIDEVDQAKAIVLRLIDLIEEANSTILEAREEWTNCESLLLPWKVAVCQGTITALLAIEGAQIGTKAAILINQAVSLMRTAQQTVESCITTKTATVPLLILSLLKDLAECAIAAVNVQ